MFGNVRTSKASNTSCFLEMKVLSLRMCRKSNEVVKKSSLKIRQGVLITLYRWLFPCAGWAHCPPARSPCHASYILTSVSVTPLRHKVCSRNTPNIHSLIFLLLSLKDGCPVLLALSKEAGFSGTESVKEGDCHRSGIWKRSGPMSCHTASGFGRNRVYHAGHFLVNVLQMYM